MEEEIAAENKRIRKQISNYVTHIYKEILLQSSDKLDEKAYNIRALIKRFFFTKLMGIYMQNKPEDRTAFYYKFKNKYEKEFKKAKDNIKAKLYSFRKSEKYEIFRNSFTDKEWQEIDGDTIVKYLTVSNTFKKSGDDIDSVINIIKITRRSSSLKSKRRQNN